MTARKTGPPPAAATARKAGPPPAAATTRKTGPPPPATSGDAHPPAPVAEPETHPVLGLDDVVHQRVRLGILTIAHEARRVEFGYLRSRLELTAGNLSKHLTVLETAGLVAVEKGYEGKRARTWITLTTAGTAALAEEISRLKALITRVEITQDRR
jgi:DNA-binding HxlR family transcriptional regulator